MQQQSQLAGEADAARDEAVLKLAAALAGEGLPRANPFKPLGFPSPSALAEQGYEQEARDAQRLAKAVLGREGTSRATLAAAKALIASANAVEAALVPLERLVEARAAAVRERDTVGQGWESRLAALKLAARMADAEGARGVFAALFSAGAPARAKRKPPAPRSGAWSAGA